MLTLRCYLAWLPPQGKSPGYEYEKPSPRHSRIRLLPGKRRDCGEREREGGKREAWISIRPSPPPSPRPPALGCCCCCCHHREMRVKRASSACRHTSLLHPSLYQSAPKITATMWPKRASFTTFPTAQHAVFNRLINADMVQSHLHHSGFLPHKMKCSPPSAASCSLHLISILHRCASSAFGIA